uniref:Uncharacterized protein n=1 Tax=Meloidogyne enterolobii TaxID=390850 RepID=A0A6V7VGD7_MELEN|nr:unnamed protein product [Meloidogyne enterolobii]
MFYYYLILLLIISLFTLNNSLKCKMALISNEVANDVTELSNKKILSQMIDTECDKNDNYCVTYTEITTLNVTENFLLHSCESLWRDNIKKRDFARDLRVILTLVKQQTGKHIQCRLQELLPQVLKSLEEFVILLIAVTLTFAMRMYFLDLDNFVFFN